MLLLRVAELVSRAVEAFDRLARFEGLEPETVAVLLLIRLLRVAEFVRVPPGLRGLGGFAGFLGVDGMGGRPALRRCCGFIMMLSPR